MTPFDPEDKDVLLATAIASGSSHVGAATQLNISPATVKRRMTEPSFRRLVADLRAEMQAAALGKMNDSLTRAAEALAGLLDAPEPHIRIRAARALFSMSMKMSDTIDIGERVRELENELARKQGVTP